MNPARPPRTTIASPTESGDRLRLEGVVVGPDCAPLVGATLDIWQADKDATYYEPMGREPASAKAHARAPQRAPGLRP